MLDVAGQRALEAPEVAELDVLVDNAVGVELPGQAICGLAALEDLLVGHEARAFARDEVVAADLDESGLLVVQLYHFPAGEHAEAEAVERYERACILEHAGKVGVVHLGADDAHTAAVPGLRVDLAVADFLQGLLQVGQDELLRTAEAYHVDDVELVAGDGRILELAELAYLRYDPADLVVAGHGITQSGVGNVHAQLLVHRVEHPVLHLGDVVLEGVVRILIRDIRVGNEEIRLLYALEQLDILHAAVHLRAGVDAADAVQEVVAALDCPLQQCAAVLTGVVRHVIRGYVYTARVRRAHSHGEAVVYVEKHLRHVVAGVAQSELALILSLADQLVVSLLEQVLKVDQML